MTIKIIILFPNRGGLIMSEEHRKRSRYFKVHLLDEELVLLEIKAEEAGMSKFEYIRNMIMFGYAKERTVFSREQERKIRNELNMIGSNINQIAIRVNTNRDIYSEDLRILREQYNNLLDLYQGIFKVENHQQ